VGASSVTAPVYISEIAPAEKEGGWSVTAYLLLYIAFFAFSQGAVIWVFISEIFPNQVRAKGQTLGSTTHWVMAALEVSICICFSSSKKVKKCALVSGS
jgi:hypothetical protein